jgi:hypothetical protein
VTDVEEWIRAYAEPTGAIELVHDRPWGTVMRVPLAGRIAWFKACPQVQAFEPRLTAELHARWPDRVAEVLRCDLPRGWLLLGDAGTPVHALEHPLDAWLDALPRHAELQRGEVAHVAEHLAHGVPDMRVAMLPARYDEMLGHELPLEPGQLAELRAFAPTHARLCDELAAFGVPDTIQHDDLHHKNLFAHAGGYRVVDWGDAVISHPFASLVVMFRFVEQLTGLAPDDAWFARLRDAYLEPWGRGYADAVELALRVGGFARSYAYTRIRHILPPEWRAQLDADLAIVLRRALAT